MTIISAGILRLIPDLLKLPDKFMHPLLDISLVDFNKVDDIVGFAMLIFSDANAHGMLAYRKIPQNSETMKIQDVAKNWIGAVRRRMDDMHPGEALSVLIPFDLVWRIAYGVPTRPEIKDSYTLSAFTAHTNGDKTIDEYILFRSVDEELNRKNEVFFDKPLEWHNACIGRWMRNFRYGINLSQQPDYDIIQQASILMKENLRAFVRNEKLFKTKLFKNSRHYFDEVGKLDIKTLSLMEGFLMAVLEFMPGNDFEECYNAINNAILIHPETNRFQRSAREINMHQIA